MKLFAMDCSWAGSIIVMAEDEAAARNLMSQFDNYDDNSDITELELKPGVIFVNYGDM